ncbi:uncharacterized protein BP5553_09407 [Venustampulla echinocandica]|uniref:Uncharacterized protein n=1 Tax=Venustampulla echinocandica TaxID=2656787 RepID=A0A370TCQ1_9HELO|nr:uncharacterized protein BP5553_09407 [Venustampulla echinocandica]RDL32005.1 hypothetical protein BP5553_09407 [Venustampulla echinocandica]
MNLRDLHSESEDDDVTTGLADEDRETLRPTRQPVGLVRGYAPGWKSHDAFREYYQNWMDGMVESRKILRSQINVSINDTEKEWVALARRSVGHELLGFIRFSKQKGELELSNFKARLEPKALSIGETSKRNNKNTAGTHGEGFKVASLVMVRKGYQVRYEASKYYWRFVLCGQNKRHLYYQLSPISESKLTKAMAKYRENVNIGCPRGTVANMWEDVTVKIGKVYGSKASGEKIKWEKFQEWIKVSMALVPPVTLIKTQYGDLVTDPEFSGRLYLKGLFLEHKKDLKFSYDLAKGHVNRDRETLASTEEEAKNFAEIWGEAIRLHKGDALKDYTKMLREDDGNKWADVKSAERYIMKDVATTIWEYLKKLGPDVFFCDGKEMAKVAQIIKTSLKKNPMPLPSCIWEPLRKFGLVRTPNEHRNYLLQNAPVSQVEETTYSIGLQRALRAALALNVKTRSLNLIFKSGAKGQLDLLIDGDNLLLYDHWLCFQQSHAKSTCRLSQLVAKVDHFSCDHIISELYGMILSELQSVSKLEPIYQDEDNSLCQMVSENLRHMPRMIRVEKTLKPGELAVSWTDPESQMAFELHGLDLKCQVTLHRESTCAGEKVELLCIDGMNPFHANDSAHFNQRIENIEESAIENSANGDLRHFSECGCPSRLVIQKSGTTTFCDLSTDEAYFPMVVTARGKSFFGLPPDAIKPAPRVEQISQEPPKTPTPNPQVDTDGLYDATPPKSRKIRPRFGSRTRPKKFAPTPRKPTANQATVEDFIEGMHEGPNHDSDNESDNGVVAGPVPTGEVHNVENKSDDGTEEVARLNMGRVRRIKQQLAHKEDQLNSTSNELASRTTELNEALDCLEGMKVQIRALEAEFGIQKQRLESTIEDLGEENRQMHDAQAESITRVEQLLATVENLRNDMQQLQEGKLQVMADHHEFVRATQENRATSEPQEVSSQGLPIQTSHADMEVLRQSNDALRSEIHSAQTDRASLVTTLNGALAMLQGVLSLGSREAMVGMLQGVITMVQAMLAMANRESSPPLVSRPKRARVKDENGVDVPGEKNAKRVRIGRGNGF